MPINSFFGTLQDITNYLITNKTLIVDFIK